MGVSWGEPVSRELTMIDQGVAAAVARGVAVPRTRGAALVTWFRINLAGPVGLARLALVVAVSVAATACSAADGTPDRRAQAAGPSVSAVAAPSAPAQSRRPQASIVAGDNPVGLAAGFGSVWVVGHPTAQIGRIDPRTNRYRGIPISNADLEQFCFLPWMGDGRVWVGHCDGGTKTLVIDPRTNRVVGSVDAFAIQAAFDRSSVWLEDNDFTSVIRVDLHTLRRIHTFPGEGLPVVGGGYAWIVRQDVRNGTDRHEIDKVDPRTNQIVSVFHPPDVGYFGRTIFAYGALWEVGQQTGRLLRVDPSTGAASVVSIPGYQPLSGGYEVFPIAAAGSIWLHSSDGIVARLDQSTGRLLGQYPADRAGGGGNIAYGFGSLWVANVGEGTVWRDRVTGRP
jgi:streptogramin lyase